MPISCPISNFNFAIDSWLLLSSAWVFGVDSVDGCLTSFLTSLELINTFFVYLLKTRKNTAVYLRWQYYVEHLIVFLFCQIFRIR